MCSSRTWKILDWVLHKIRAKLSGKLTLEEVDSKRLTWNSNIYGDFIFIADCRSLWVDKYGNFYRCESIYKKKLNHLGIEE